MERYNDAGAGEALEEVHRIHPALDRLRDLLTSATALDLKASAKGYWSERGHDGDRAITSP
jgi:hypothetical protein